MPNKKISELDAAGALTGAELVEIVQGGQNVQSTTQNIADLGGGGGVVDSVNGQTGVVVLDGGDIGNTPAGSIAATDVQAAINELDGSIVTVSGQVADHLADATAAHAATAISFAPAGTIASTTVQAAIEEVAAEAGAGMDAKYILDQVSTSTASGTITLNMNSQVQRSHVGSASFATPKTVALSNTTNSLFFNWFFNVTNVAGVLTMPSDFISADDAWDDSANTWTPPQVGKYTMHGEFDDTNNEWGFSVYGPKL